MKINNRKSCILINNIKWRPHINTYLYEDMAAEQKARSTYEYIMNLTDDPDVLSPIKFLREREIVHFQRFGEALRKVQDYMDSKRQFIINKPDFNNNGCGCKK